MSQINFDTFRREAPDLKDVWSKLEHWINQNSSTPTLDPRRLAIDLYPIPALDLARALSILVREHAVRQVYKVTAPNGVLLVGEFDDVHEIPDQLPDRTFDQFVDVRPSNIVPVFRIGATSEQP